MIFSVVLDIQRPNPRGGAHHVESAPPRKGYFQPQSKVALHRQTRVQQSSIAQVADAIGYDSEAAFNRAFKRATGHPPAAWRKASAKADHDN